jgi:hypothetical protein
MTESFVKTMKRDYVALTPKPDAATAARNLAIAFEHYNEKHPHSALKYRAPREFRCATDSATKVGAMCGVTGVTPHGFQKPSKLSRRALY